jgi:hypothetical protein
MGRFEKHEPCPACGSRDNLGVWDDGKWCFGCGYRERVATSVAAVERLRTKRIPTEGVSGVMLPNDCTNQLSTEAKRWLTQYDISWPIQLQHDILWSESRKLLIFPIHEVPISTRRLVYNLGAYTEGVIAWQGRYFGTDPKHPKYHSEGPIGEVIDLCGNIDDDSVFVVEDKLSAIKLGQLECSMPLYGSHIGEKRAKYLSRRFENLNIWLDADKKKEAMKQAIQLSPMFRSVSVIYTEKDPKEYGLHSIRNILTEQLKYDKAPVDTGD